MITDPLLWFFAALGAFMVGVSKAGITGLSILSIALFNHVFPSSKQASGLVLPLLIFGDFVAVFAYRKHTQWRYLWRLFPWTAAGVVIGYFTLGRISDHSARILIGWIIVSLAVLSFWRKYAAAPVEELANQMKHVERDRRPRELMVKKLGYVESDHGATGETRHHRVDRVVEYPRIIALCVFAPTCQACVHTLRIGGIEKLEQSGEAPCRKLERQGAAQCLIEIGCFARSESSAARRPCQRA